MESRHTQAIIPKLLAAGGILLLLFLWAMWPHSPAPPVHTPALPPVPEFFTQNLRHGDLLFREGKTLASEMARKASTRDRRFSHVGIVFKEEKEFFVIHAIHDEHKGFHGVVRESLAGFLADGNAFGAYRMNLEKSAVHEIAQRAKTLFEQKTPYDHNYDLTESEKLYCTEFIFHLFQGAALESLVGRTEFLGKEVIAIDDIYEDRDFFEMIF